MCKSVYILLSFLLTLLFSCIPDSDSAGTISDVDVEVAGIVVDSLKQPLKGALVELGIPVGSRRASEVEIIDSTITDPLGKYQFDSLQIGTYHIFVTYDGVCIDSQKNIVCDAPGTYTVKTISQKSKTPEPIFGSISGTVGCDPEDLGEVSIFIEGTSLTTHPNPDGSFLIEKVPPAEGYKIIMEHEKYYSDTVVQVAITGKEVVALEKKVILTSLSYLRNFSASYDKTTRVITLQWDEHPKSELYNIYRKSNSIDSGKGVILVNSSVGLTYSDTIDDIYFTYSDTISMEYHIEGVSEDKAVASSNAIAVEVVIERDESDPKEIIGVGSMVLGESLEGGETYELSWFYKGLIDSVIVSFSRDSGRLWEDINSEPLYNRGKFLWRVPEADSKLCLVKISSLKDSSLSGVSSIFSVVKSDRNLLKNGSFFNGLNSWTLLDDNAFLKLGYITEKFEAGVLHIDIDSLDTMYQSPSYYQNFIAIEKEKSYKLSYDIKASNRNHQIEVSLRRMESPWPIYDIGSSLADTIWRRDTVYLASQITDSEASLLIGLGTDTGEVWIDNISLEEVD